ncbi:fungal-specific transcription factor domain-containing protein [Echria macrotheca]|uniref:Fungal-specific transcription factor domain-containing protein n=1 Tax=Echria macrotheca TaxID=438768 RepID=A0AAJ0F5N2_9PEZI|nr:fungal-specific transcription factor domain-containing protein [Echria macrotheca]
MAASKCHNCRRRRLRCDRSFPACLKCSVNGEACLGYGQILRWADAPALRGRLAGKHRASEIRTGPTGHVNSPDDTEVRRADDEVAELGVIASLLDPMVNNLDRKSRYYVHHFATTVCRDLVSIDQDNHNPFRIMIPLITHYQYLEAIVIATSAMHLATLHRFRAPDVPTTGRELVDALAAKGRAIRLLHDAVEGTTTTMANRAPLLAAVVFFVNLDLIDSGKGGWKAHMKAARSLIAAIYRSSSIQNQQVDATLAPLADAITADCLTYHILASTISTVPGPSAMDKDVDVLAVLERAQAYSYHGCPPVVMRSILRASHPTTADPGQLLDTVRSVDVHAWVQSITGLPAHDDTTARIELASAHRAAACLYILLSSDQSVDKRDDIDNMVLQILQHLEKIPGDHVLLKGTVWPTFMAGAQTDDPYWRAWCFERLRAVWTRNPWVCPWGYVLTATEMMERIWTARDKGEGTNWLRGLKDSKEDLLIV